MWHWASREHVKDTMKLGFSSSAHKKDTVSVVPSGHHISGFGHIHNIHCLPHEVFIHFVIFVV